jgi:8-oxo-dGTP diphosphatase
MIKNDSYDPRMTTLGSLVKAPSRPLDIQALAVDINVLAVTSSATIAQPLGTLAFITASLTAWTFQDDDAHEPCSLVACRAPLHPGPCKGWKGTLHSVAPGTYKQIEDERVRKANERRVKRIAELKSQGKPIPRRLLSEIKPKPAPGTGAGGAAATPPGKVNQQADLAGGQAHTASQAINQQAGVKTNIAPLPTGPKGKKPTVAGRGPAFVITQPKVTDQYKLDKAEKLTAAEWAALSPADKKAIRDELEAIKVRGFGPQQARATTLLAKLPAASTLGTSATPAATPSPQAPSAAPGRTTLGKAVKTVPTTTGRGAAAAAPAAADAARKAADGATSTADVLSAVDKVGPGALNPVQRDAIGARLKFIANHPKATDAQKKAARAQMARLGVDGGPATPPPGATPPPVAPGKPTLPSPGPAPAPTAKASLPSPGGPATVATKVSPASVKVGDVVEANLVSGQFKVAQIKLTTSNLKNSAAAYNFYDDKGTHFFIGRANAKATVITPAPAGPDGAAPSAPQPNAPTATKATPTTAPAGAVPAPVAATKAPTLPSPGPTPASTPAPTLPSPSNGPTPQAPATPSSAPKVFPPNVQHARAVAGRAVGRPTSKAHVDAYGTLTKADFDSLDQATQRTIRDDLANASAKFLDPAKKQAAKDLLNRFGSRHATPAPGAPPVVAHPKGYSDPQQQAVKAATSGLIDSADMLKSVARLTPDQIAKLDDADRKAVLTRLAFIATHPKASADVKAQAATYGRIANGNTRVPDSKKWDHDPSIGELAREEESGGHAAKFDALIAAQDTTMDKADRLKALTALTKIQFGSLPAVEQRRITDALHELHYDRSLRGTGLDAGAEKALITYTGMPPALHRLSQAEADFKAGKITGDALHSQLLSARVQAPPTTHKAVGVELDAMAARIARDNPSIPTYARVRLAGDPQYGGAAYSSIGLAAMKHMWDPAPRLSVTDFSQLFRATDDDLKAVDPIHAQAVRDLRENILKTGLAFSSPWSDATKNQAIDSALGIADGGEIPRDKLAAFKAMPDGVQKMIIAAMRVRQSNQTDNYAKTRTWIALRELQGSTPLAGDLRAAVLAATDSYASPSKQDIYRRLDPIDFLSLPGYSQDAISAHLEAMHQRKSSAGANHLWSAGDNPLTIMPRALAAHLAGERDTIPNREERNASDIALYGTGIVAPPSRVAAYNRLTPMTLQALPQGTQRQLLDDLDKIENDSSLFLQTRYDAAMNRQVFLKSNSQVTLTPAQVSAVQAADMDPRSRYTDLQALSTFHNLTKADYDSLSPTFREAIDVRLNAMPGPAQQIITAKFHPQAAPAMAQSPAGTVPTAVQENIPPHVQAALDTIYGLDPKSHTMAHQLKTYGALRGSDFSAFNVQEQQQLLSDLSFIETTAKGPSADKARKLIDRFTPPGTPTGQTPGNPAIIPPANALPGQVRYATPQVGTLVMAKDKGKGGDGWVTTPGGKRVWGKYGAAGLLLQHVDPNTGEKRYLMVQRGPGISDPGKWQFPGGAIDEKETFHQGGAREVIEELGFKPDDLKSAAVVGEHTSAIPGSTWKYVSIAAQVPAMLKPDLSTHHARMETSDAKWMTESEIKALDTSGKLLAPLAGGKLEQNVISLFPATSAAGTGKLGQVARPGPVTKRLPRMTMPAGGRQAPAAFNAWPYPHKPSTGKNLIPDKASFDAQRQKIKNDRKLYDGKTADGRLAAIGAQQGFDDTPTVLDKKEIDRLLATGDYIEAWRGVSGAGGGWSARSRGGSGGKTAAQINEEMRSGPAYYGKGIFGNGYYLATQKSVAAQYSDHTAGSMVRILIPKSAIMKKYDEVAKEAGSRSSRTSKAKGAPYGETSTFWDPGRYAAAIGVDGIEIQPHHMSPGGGARHVAATGKPAFNWLNRSVLILQKEPG